MKNDIVYVVFCECVDYDDNWTDVTLFETLENAKMFVKEEFDKTSKEYPEDHYIFNEGDDYACIYSNLGYSIFHYNWYIETRKIL